MSTSEQIHRDVGHPIIDADGHVLEVLEATYPHLREALGATRFEEWLAGADRATRAAAPHDRRPSADAARRRARGGGPRPSTCATARPPRCRHSLAERSEEIGIDYFVLYPTNTLLTCAEEDPDLRQGLCAGFNAFFADVYGPYADRMTMAALVPMHTPEEAIAELEHCHGARHQGGVLPRGRGRPLTEPAGPDCNPFLFPGQAHWFDSFGLDSLHDYDPVWAKCQELGYAVTFHGGMTVRPGINWSISSYVANHVGQFAMSMYPLVQVAALRWRDAAVPRPSVRVPGVRRVVGHAAAGRRHRALGEAQPRRAARCSTPRGSTATSWARTSTQYPAGSPIWSTATCYELVSRFPIAGNVPDQPDEFAAWACRARPTSCGCSPIVLLRLRSRRPRHGHRVPPVEPRRREVCGRCSAPTSGTGT